jgi:hypothetical protein
LYAKLTYMPLYAIRERSWELAADYDLQNVSTGYRKVTGLT